eukprot:gene14467-15971_t
MSKTYFRSEIVEIQCRVCCKTLLQKNYKDHLKAKHPKEDYTNTTPLGQKKLSASYFSVQSLQTSTKRSRSSVDKKALHDEVESPTKTQRISLKELEACESLDPVLEGDVIERADQLPTERKNEESTLNTTLEKLSSIPKSTDITVLEKLGEIQNQLTRIEHMMKSRPETVAQPAHENPPVETGKGVRRLKAIRSLNELLELGFTHESDSSELRCMICEDANNVNPEKTTDHGIFTYENDLEKDFESREFLPREFINLKKSIKRHLTDSVTHKKNVQAEEQRKAERNLLERKNEKAGMNLGRLCMKLFLKGRPYTDYEDDVLVEKINGSVVGELNHSRKFPPAFRPFVSRAVARRVATFINTRLVQTGHFPAVNITADKATYKHHTRQFLSCVTVVPGAGELLQVISFGQPIVKGHTGIEIAKNMKEGFDKFNLQSSQIEGGSFDGQYFHLRVEEALESAALYDLPPKNVLWAWDAMHKSGLVDTHLCKEKRFKWLVDDTDVCSQLFRLFNWGQNHEKLVEASVLWKLHLKDLVKFSETRFANSRRQVYVNVHHDLQALVTCLEDKVALSYQNPSDGKLRQKANEAKQLLGKLLNVRFLLTLAGCADVYGQYGKIVNAAQIVNLLPHERLELFMKEVTVLGKMKKCLSDHKNCSSYVDEKAKVRCLFPLLHADRDSLQTNGEIQKIPVVDQSATIAASLQSRTRQMGRQATIAQNVDAEKQVHERLEMLIATLHSGLKEEVFDDQAITVINHTKTVLNLPEVAAKLKDPDGGYIKNAVINGPLFVDAIRSVPVRSLNNVSDDELKRQYRLFFKKLEELTKQSSLEELRVTDPKSILKQFFDPKLALFTEIEMVMQAISVCCVKVSCESVLESLVSIFENHFDARRNMNEESTTQEFLIAINGPNLSHADAVIKEAMNSYWRSKGSTWHFFRTSVLEQLKEYAGGSQ